MTIDLSARLRIVRAAVFAGVCVTLAAAGHSVSEGAVIGARSWILSFFLIFVLAAAAAGREFSQKTLTLGLLAVQLVSHLVFVIDAPASSPMPDMDMSVPATMAGPGPAAMIGHGGWAMLLSHLLAGLVSGWWLRRGEAASWRWVRRAEAAASSALRAAWTGLTLTDGPSTRGQVLIPAVERRRPGRPTTGWLVRCSPRRGPPRAAVI